MTWAMEAFVFRSAGRGSPMGSKQAAPRRGRRVLGPSRNGRSLSAETVVIGAGQAGLAVSHELLRRGVNHVVLERGRVGETWRSQRWESFVLNTPVWMNLLPGASLADPNPTRFPTRWEFVESLERYVETQRLPLRENVEVLAVEADGGTYIVDTSAARYRAGSVIVAAGAQRTPRIPAIARALPPAVEQLHAASYRSPDRLPPGAVLVVGSGQTGCQITEELLEAGRLVYLATSRVGRLPRRYRGRDVLEWRCEMGFYEQTPAKHETYESLRAPMPITSGVRGGHTISLQQFARKGAILLGRLDRVSGTRVGFAADLSVNLRFADEFAAEVRRSIDDYIRRRHLDAPPGDADPAEAPQPRLGRDPPRELELRGAGVGAILWATGFGSDFEWLPSSLLDRHGAPAHSNGIGHAPGFYTTGSPWLSKRKSGIIYGVGEDASRIAADAAKRAAQTR
jgi:putative flavoprotein involved in K+ transport